ncbi:hypothetical protein KIF59_19030 [Enterobacter cloacae subsp. cloacae]|nr:hypothetical protein [Enterobacter cloacae subsp. cloacae]
MDEPGVGVDPISRRETVANGPRAGGRRNADFGAPPYLDEAEQCRDVLLMNERAALSEN